MNIAIRSSHTMRYDTIGDWQFTSDGDLLITVKTMANKYFVLIAIHEMVEAILCQSRGIPESSVDEWDMVTFPKMQEENDSLTNTEPGDHPICPYHEPHRIAEQVERKFAKETGIDWEQYCEDINKL